MIRISKEWIIKTHETLINLYGGSHGLRDEGILDSALNAPLQTFDGQPLYPTISQKAARLGYGLIENHPFIDGNKRIGAFAMEAFLNLNGVELVFASAEFIDIILEVASHKKDCQELCSWIQQHKQD